MDAYLKAKIDDMSEDERDAFALYLHSLKPSFEHLPLIKNMEVLGFDVHPIEGCWLKKSGSAGTGVSHLNVLQENHAIKYKEVPGEPEHTYYIQVINSLKLEEYLASL